MGKKINQSADNSTKINHMLGFSDKDFKAAITKLFKQVIINPLEKKSLKQPERKDTLSLGELQLE